MKNVKVFFVAMMMVLCCICSTGCGVNDATEKLDEAKNSAVEAAVNAKDQASWWTRKTASQCWTNPDTGTEVSIRENRKDGSYTITVVYKDESVEDSWEGCKTSGATVSWTVDQITDDLIDDLREQ